MFKKPKKIDTFSRYVDGIDIFVESSIVSIIIKNKADELPVLTIAFFQKLRAGNMGIIDAKPRACTG